MLLDNGAHKNVRNKDGETAADIAKRLGNKAVQELFRQDIGRAVQRACQSYSADRILNGEVAADDELPWMAALGYFINERSFQIVFSCGGTIISNNFIMTAAHCVKNQRPVVVRMGKISLVDSDDDDTSTAIHRSIKNIMIHPGHSTLTKQNDIALIEIKKLIPFSQYIRPACLQINLRDEPLNVKLIVSGWGITSPEQNIRSTVLRKTELVSMPLAQCNSSYLNWNRPINDAAFRNGLIGGQYCAYDPAGRNDSCQGDSGGPLQYFANNGTSVATVVGIVSFGVSCGLTLPSIYTRVAYYLDWLEPIVWPNY
ncbi:serine protease persephone-like [Contarinia nasturtii]|uniref:serine protease persephone-like n=1 Tax=Contarinia nasturtii TaxID=265458 RepID=UPI0012D463C9|nr:serine protease persephone-like [Contarinia nasturtii]XP_031621928.1 serine protease persephone-like [Contarinia nasturtii]